MELWSSRTPETGTIERQVERAEEQAWTGVTFTDSQNLVRDPFVAAAPGSRVTERLRFATGVLPRDVHCTEHLGNHDTQTCRRERLCCWHAYQRVRKAKRFTQGTESVVVVPRHLRLGEARVSVSSGEAVEEAVARDVKRTVAVHLDEGEAKSEDFGL